MKLSELVYQVVKQAVYFEENNEITLQKIREYAFSLTTTSINQDGISISSDYRRNLDNAMFVINNAIQRVQNLGKTSLKILEIPNFNGSTIDLNSLNFENFDPSSVYRIITIYTQGDNGYKVIPYNTVGRLKVVLKKKINKTLYIEYEPSIKFYDFEDIQYHEDGDVVIDHDVDLIDLGINNMTCSFIILWCKGTLGRDIYGNEADRWVNQAEAYFLDLDNFNGDTPHFQDYIDSDWKID